MFSTASLLRLDRSSLAQLKRAWYELEHRSTLYSIGVKTTCYEVKYRAKKKTCTVLLSNLGTTREGEFHRAAQHFSLKKVISYTLTYVVSVLFHN